MSLGAELRFYPPPAGRGARGEGLSAPKTPTLTLPQRGRDNNQTRIEVLQLLFVQSPSVDFHDALTSVPDSSDSPFGERALVIDGSL